METLGNQNQQNSAMKYYCKYCDYGTSRKYNYDTHKLSAKHKIMANGNHPSQNQQFVSNTPHYTCEKCDKHFKNRSGLWKHNKKCSNDKISINTTNGQQELVQFLLKENAEFKQLMMEQNKHMLELAKNTAGHHNTNVVNNNNQQFNLQFYLNETCKNAMNIMDFINQLPVSLKHLEDTGRLGFAEGISKIFIDGLKQINVNDRPIHCSDFKRETLYIKNNNEWNKDSEQKTILTNAIKHVTHKNMKNISEWTKINPEYNDTSSKVNDRYLKIVSESMSGSTVEETNKNYSKIVKNILKETVIDKSHG
jgi:hypothetical protein